MLLVCERVVDLRSKKFLIFSSICVSLWKGNVVCAKSNLNGRPNHITASLRGLFFETVSHVSEGQHRTGKSFNKATSNSSPVLRRNSEKAKTDLVGLCSAQLNNIDQLSISEQKAGLLAGNLSKCSSALFRYFATAETSK